MGGGAGALLSERHSAPPARTYAASRGGTSPQRGDGMRAAETRIPSRGLGDIMGDARRRRRQLSPTPSRAFPNAIRKQVARPGANSQPTPVAVGVGEGLAA